MRIIIATIFLLFLSQIQAQVITWTAAGDGLSWNDPNNWDVLAIPLAGDDVFIESDTVRIDGAGGVAGSVFIGDARLLVQSSLTIANSDTFGFYCLRSSVLNLGDLTIVENGEQFDFEHALHLDSSIFVNRGTFEVLASAGRGIYIDSESQFINRGPGQISNTLDRGVFADGIFDNFDTIAVSNTSFSPYLINDTCFNRTGAHMVAFSVAKLGNHGIALGGVLINKGHISLSNIEASGIYNGGSIFNYDRINIDSTGEGISNEDTIINMLDAEITISNIQNDGLINGFNVSQNAFLENGGLLTLDQITGPAIINRGHLSILETGILQVDQWEDSAIEVVDGAILLVEGELLLMN